MSADEKKPEPKWISDLSRVASVAQRMERKTKGTFGAANKGKRLTAWFCACGWEGSSQELKAGPERALLPDVWRRRTKGEVNELAGTFMLRGRYASSSPST